MDNNKYEIVNGDDTAKVIVDSIINKKLIKDHLNELIKSEEILIKKIVINKIKQKILSLQRYHPIIKTQMANMGTFQLGKWIKFDDVIKIIEEM